MASRQFRSDDTSKWAYGFGNSSDGALTISANTTEAPVDSACTGTIGETSLSATNASFVAGQAVLIHDAYSTGVWELNKISSYTAGTITLALTLCNTYNAGSQVMVLKQYSSVTVNTGQTWSAKAWNGTVGGILGFLCNGSFTVAGTGRLNLVGASGVVGTPGTGIGFKGGNPGYQGQGTGGAGAVSTAANGNGGGGGGNPQGGAGGGNGTAGENGTGSTAGGASGNAGLTLMTMGGAGGGCGTGGTSDGGGGAGGGIILAIAKNISLGGTGVTTLTGGNGGTATNNDMGAGGGAGGSCLLKGQTVALGTNLILSNAGAGAKPSPYPGGNGAVGRIHVDYKTSLSGTTTPTLDSTQDATLNNTYMGGFIFNIL